MKKFILSSILLMSVIFSYAYNFNVYGYIIDDDGNPVVQQDVMIRAENCGDSAFAITYTDGNGYYSANIELEGTQNIFIEVYSWNCYSYYSETVEVSGEGSQQVDFEVCSANGETDCFTYYFYDYDYENPFLINFTSFVEPSDDNTTYTWVFGDSDIHSTEANPTHEYSEEGEYIVTLIANNEECGEMIYEDVVYVYNYNDTSDYARCFADFYFEFDPVSTTNIHFIDFSWSMDDITGWNWDFGDGQTSTEQNPTHEYGEEGEYFVSLTITTPSCESSIEFLIYTGENTWYPDECQALFFADYNWNDYFTVNFIDMSWGSGNGNINSYQWNFGDGNGSAEQNPTHTYTEEGQYDVELIIFTDSCTSTFNETVFIENWDNPGDCSAFFFPEFDSITTNVQFYDLSIPESTYWNWSFGDGETSFEQNPLHQYAGTGIYLVSLTSGIGDCESTFEMEIEIREFEGKDKEVIYEGVIRRAYAVHESSTTAIKNTVRTASQYFVYPNPVSNELNINFDYTTDAKISIINIAGQEIKRIELSDKNSLKADVSSLPAGIYFAKINAGNHIETVKFIKK